MATAMRLRGLSIKRRTEEKIEGNKRRVAMRKGKEQQKVRGKLRERHRF
jgi:hypothetical protein